MEEVFGNPSVVELVPQVSTTGSYLFGPVTTDALGGIAMVETPMRHAMEYIRERGEKFIFHLCGCAYCRSVYPANLELGYECPACGAYDFEIKESIKDTV